MRLLSAIVASLCFALLCGCKPKEGQIVPPTTLTAPDGSAITAHDLDGKVVVYVFSGIGCTGCEQFAPTVKQVAEGYPKDKVLVVDCNIWDDTASGAKQLQDHSGIAAVQGGKQLYAWCGMHVIPSFLVVGRDGRLVKAVDGVQESTEIYDALKTALLQH